LNRHARWHIVLPAAERESEASAEEEAVANVNGIRISAIIGIVELPQGRAVPTIDHVEQ
jgi:hypothetical protein